MHWYYNDLLGRTRPPKYAAYSGAQSTDLITHRPAILKNLSLIPQALHSRARQNVKPVPFYSQGCAHLRIDGPRGELDQHCAQS